MRLLKCRNDDGEYRLTDDLSDDEVPPYAILSHTWMEGQEVTFQDIQENTGREKSGYDKIGFCSQQAERDGLQYFWVDTCCIDKSNYGELKEAINSMFRWYQNAEKCYVFLPDVLTPKEKANDECADVDANWELAFSASRWFCRGWTLQELLAPTSVEFFSRQHQRLGDRKSLVNQIQKITGISKLALQGAPMSQFTVNEKLSWIENRQTTKEEDRAYSLLGLFNVYMPPIYGEGTAAAFRRLMDEVDMLMKCQRDLRLTDPRDDKKRIEATKGGILEESYYWILEAANFQRWRDDERNRLLWVKGDPGKGKTMLLCGIINELQRMKGKEPTAKTNSISFFFCQATDSRINNATAVLRGLIYLLIDQQPSLATHLRVKYDQAGPSMYQDANAWVALSDVLTAMLRSPSLKTTTFLVIDALDECIQDLPRLLDLIISTSKSSASGRVKWLLSSRNEAHIEQKLRSIREDARLGLELKDNADQVTRAVELYIDNRLSGLDFLEGPDREQVRNILHRKANGTFLWVALVIQELQSPECWDPVQAVEEAPTGLYELYNRMLDQIRRLNERNSQLCRLLLSIASVAYRPLFLTEMAALCGLSGSVESLAKRIKTIISLCGSFLAVRDQQIYLIHQSVKDYLTDENQAAALFQDDDVHHTIFSQSLKMMSGALKRDMYNLIPRGVGCPIEEIEQPDPDPLLLLRYPCVYWIDHLAGSGSASTPDILDGGSVEFFIKKNYLYWLEALSLCKNMSKGVLSMLKLGGLIQGRTGTMELYKLVRDACRFIMSHKRAIENSPLQVYASALIFSPQESLIRCLFRRESLLPKLTIKPDMNTEWDACMQTLEGHNDRVHCVAFSHDSKKLASAAGENIRIWDASSGECVQNLEEHVEVKCLSFDPHNSTRLVSALDDGIISVWDLSSGNVVRILKGHTSCVPWVALSCSSELASASSFGVIKLWDVNNGECLQTIENFSVSIQALTFSHDLKWLCSVSLGGHIEIRHLETGECLQELEHIMDDYQSLAFSHQSRWLASGARDIRIWDTRSGECVKSLNSHSLTVTALAFSNDSKRLYSSSLDGTIKVWDVNKGECLQTLRSHYGAVSSLAISHDSERLVSGSWDLTLKIWDISQSSQPTKDQHVKHWPSLVLSRDTKWLASSTSESVKIWDVSSSECIQELDDHFFANCALHCSTDSAWLASLTYAHGIRVFNLKGGSRCAWQIDSLDAFTGSPVFSHDARLLAASPSDDTTILIWDSTDGKCLQILKGHGERVRSIGFSHDSVQLASGSEDGAIKIWNLASGKCLHTFENPSSVIMSVVFSQDSTRVASLHFVEKIKIWDVQSGACVQTVLAGINVERLYSFDLASSCIHTNSGTVVIPDTPVSSDAYSPNSLPLQKAQAKGLNLRGKSIRYSQQILLWFPSEYRPRRNAVVGNKVFIVDSFGVLRTYCFGDLD